MFELLPLLKGWQYRIEMPQIPETFTTKMNTVLSEQDISGWFISAEVLSDDDNLNLKIWLDGVLVANSTPQDFYYGKSKLVDGIANTFLYGQRISSTNTQLYGMILFTPTGYPFANSIKINFETTKNSLYVKNYRFHFIEITDPDLFKQGLKDIYGYKQEVVPPPTPPPIPKPAPAPKTTPSNIIIIPER
jgi:hypothetical protein